MALLKTIGTPKDISASVPPFTADMNFTNFGVDNNHHDFVKEEGFEATYIGDINSNAGATTSILADINEVREDSTNDRQKRKKKGLKGFFSKGDKI